MTQKENQPVIDDFNQMNGGQTSIQASVRSKKYLEQSPCNSMKKSTYAHANASDSNHFTTTDVLGNK